MAEFTWQGRLHDHDIERLTKQFDDQGYIIIKQIFDGELVQKAKRELDRIIECHANRLMAAGKINDRLKEASFETRLYFLYKHCLDDAPKSFRQELHLAGLFPLFFNPDLLDVVQLFVGDEIRLYPNYTVRPKFPEWEGTQVLWHQDAGYTEQHVQKVESGTSVNAFRMINVWMPLVPAQPENGCMQFIPGTHRLGVVPHESRKYYLEIPNGILQPLLQHAVDVILDPGDVVLFNNLLIHQGQPNRSGQIRWSMDWRYQDLTQPTNRKEQGHIVQ